MMRRIHLLSPISVILLILLLFVLHVPSCLAQDGSVEHLNLIKGTWVLKSIYKTQNVEGPNPSQQKKLLGTSIIVNERVLKACGKSVPINSIKVNQISSDDFLANTRVRFSEVGISAANIKEVVVNNRQLGTCFGSFPLPGQDIYIKNKDELLIYFEGVFYRAVRKN